MGNQNLYIKEEWTTQWPKGKVEKDKQDIQNIHIKRFSTMHAALSRKSKDCLARNQDNLVENLKEIK
jgi:hypothetical protein